MFGRLRECEAILFLCQGDILSARFIAVDPTFPAGERPVIFFLVTPFQIVFVGKSLGEALAQVWRVMLWESTGKVRPLGVCGGDKCHRRDSMGL